MTSESVKKTFLIRHFMREDLEDYPKFKSDLESISDGDIRKISSINPKLHDNLDQFVELISIYKTDTRKDFCTTNAQLCLNFDKYEKLAIEKITVEREEIIGERRINVGPRAGTMVPTKTIVSKDIMTYFNPEECEVWSSPFLRCLQTAMFIARLLGVTHVNVHFGLSELCDPDVLLPFADELTSGATIDINRIYENTSARIISGATVPVARIVRERYENINDSDHSNYVRRISDTIRSIHIGSHVPNKFIISHADSIKQFNIIPGSGGMDYYIKYDITDKISMEGGSKELNKYIVYMHKIEKYNKKINELKNKYLV